MSWWLKISSFCQGQGDDSPSIFSSVTNWKRGAFATELAEEHVSRGGRTSGPRLLGGPGSLHHVRVTVGGLWPSERVREN